MKCCDVTVTAKYGDVITKVGHARGLKWGKIIDCDTCLDKAYLAAANACGGEDCVVDHDARVEVIEANECADMC